MILLVGVCFTTISCTKEKTLKGTSWIASVPYSSYTANYTLSFYESTFTLDRRDSDGDFFTDAGTYTYNAPIVTLFYSDGGSVSGSVSGDNLLINGIAFIKR